MTADAIPLNVGALPSILAGPMVRRLTRTEVTVWAALKHGDPVTLHIRENGTGITDSWTKSPLRIGKHLYLIVFHIDLANLPNPSLIGSEFTPLNLYEYWLESNQMDINFDWSYLGYDGLQHPSFVGLPLLAEQFNFAHMSCRKLHGGGRDGLAALDTLIKDAAGNPALRPHCLMLTGDQIYADEVPPVIVPRLLRINDDIVAIGESLLDNLVVEMVDVGPPGNPTLVEKKLQIRGKYKPAWGFGSGNHLWRLGEYYATYLLYWSNALWPVSLPTWQDCESMVDLDSSLNEEKWEELSFQVKNFVNELPLVTKALANTPTWMIMDDHEVTDDWNLNYKWAYQVYHGFAGPPEQESQRVITNAMATYALFQHWGNVPAEFEVPNSPAKRVRDALAWVDPDGDGIGLHPLDAQTPLFSMADVGLPDRNRPDWVDPYDPANINGTFVLRPEFINPGAHPPGIRYSYTVEPDNDNYPVRFVALDPRTPRDFVGLTAYGGRLESHALDAMLPPPGPTTDLSVPTVIAFAVPVIALHARDNFLVPLLMHLKKDEAKYDIESTWDKFANKYMELLQRIASYSPVILLAGDVHFSYAKRVIYEEYAVPGDETSGQKFFIGQFTVSASKNADPRTVTLALVGEYALQLKLARDRAYVVYDTLTPEQQRALISPPSNGTVALPWDDYVDLVLGRVYRTAVDDPAIVPVEIAAGFDLDNVGANPEKHFARYEIEYIDHQPLDNEFDLPTRHAGIDDVVNDPNLPGSWTGWDADISVRVVNAMRLMNQVRIANVLQGMGLLGYITFSENNGDYTATQRLQMAIGTNTALPLERNMPGKNLFEIITDIPLWQ